MSLLQTRTSYSPAKALSKRNLSFFPLKQLCHFKTPTHFYPFHRAIQRSFRYRRQTYDKCSPQCGANCQGSRTWPHQITVLPGSSYLHPPMPYPVGPASTPPLVLLHPPLKWSRLDRMHASPPVIHLFNNIIDY